jgi:hypothetical protein
LDLSADGAVVIHGELGAQAPAEESLDPAGAAVVALKAVRRRPGSRRRTTRIKALTSRTAASAA